MHKFISAEERLLMRNKITEEFYMLYPSARPKVNKQAEIDRLMALIKREELEIFQIQERLANEDFLLKAPTSIVEATKSKILTIQKELTKAKEALICLTNK